jgi:hypothetical protein
MAGYFPNRTMETRPQLQSSVRYRMPSLKELLIERANRARASGRAVTVTIDSPMTRDQIVNLESRCGRLPSDIRELGEYAAKFSVDGFAVDFRGEQSFEFEALFPCSVPIATDGKGNFWVVDVGSDGAWGTVFFIAHDPPVAIVQARDVGSFLGQVFDAHGATALKGDVVPRIWKENPYVVSRAQALASPDPAVKAFAEQVNDNFAIADVRDSECGKGFIWGSAGPNTQLHRAGEELLFAIEQKKRGLLARLFSP